MRVAHLTTVDSSLRYLLLAQLLAVGGEGDEAVGISAPGPCVADLNEAGIRHIALQSSTRRMSILADCRAARELWGILRRERFDILHTHNPKPGIYGRVIGRLAGVPVVVHTTHGLYATPDDRWPKRVSVYALEAFASRFSHAELVQNPEDLALMARLHLVRRSKLVMLGNGVDLTRFDARRFSPADRADLRESLGIGSGQVVVGAVGRLVAEKGYVELFDAMAALGDRYALVVIGPDDPDKEDRLPADVIDRARAQGVRFLGMRNDVDALYSAMDVFVLPSHREGFPRAAMEAAAMGLPVVTTDVRGCRQVVEDGVNGLLVPARDPLSLGAAIGRLGDDIALRRRMGEAGQDRAVHHFDERHVVAIVLRTYAETAARTSGRRGRRWRHPS